MKKVLLNSPLAGNGELRYKFVDLSSENDSSSNEINLLEELSNEANKGMIKI